MKKYKRILTFLISVLIMIQSIMFNTQVVYAQTHVEGDNVVYREAATIPEMDFTYAPVSGNYKYIVDDASHIPTGGGYCFFKYGNNDKFGAVPQSQVIALIVNRGLGLVMSDEKMTSFYTAYIAATNNMDVGHLYYGNACLGLVLNDISGCVFDQYPQNTDIDIPSQEVNNVYNYYQYYISEVSPQTPDYINVQTYDLDTVKTLLNVSNSYTTSYNSIIDAVGNGLSLYYWKSGSENYLVYRNGTFWGLRYIDDSQDTCYAYNESSFDTFCVNRGLVQTGDTVGYTNLISSATGQLDVYLINANTGTTNTSWTRYNANTNGTYTTNTDTQTYFMLCNKDYIPCSKDAHKITVYRNSATLTSVVNKTYAPSTYTSTTYNDYNTNSDNSISTNTSVVNNSQTTNNEIYNDASESFSEYYSNQENYNIDNSVVIQSTTEIIYNYYGNDSGGGGEGGGGSDDDDNDLIWNAMLKAIVDFFKKLGELIAAVITGILGLFTQVLDALAQITTNFTSLTNFFASILGFLPTEMTTVLTAALGLVLLCCVIRIFRR